MQTLFAFKDKKFNNNCSQSIQIYIKSNLYIILIDKRYFKLDIQSKIADQAKNIEDIIKKIRAKKAYYW